MKKQSVGARAISAANVPPYCFRLPGMSAEEGAVNAVREMSISTPADALALLWVMRRDAATEEADEGLCIGELN